MVSIAAHAAVRGAVRIEGLVPSVDVAPGAKESPGRPAAGSAHRNATCGLCIRLFHKPCKVTGRRTTPARPDSRMSTFLNFLSAAADFALTLNLKVAIVAAGFIVLLVLTR